MTQQDAPATNPISAAAPEPSPPGAAAVEPVRPWQWALLVVIVLAAVGLRVHGLTVNSLWIDEFFSVEASSGHGPVSLEIPRGQIVDDPPRGTRLDASDGAVRRVWTSLDRDQHPPLYFLALRLWRDAFGSSVGAMRGLSVLVSVLAVVALFDLGRHLIGPVAALWGCLILALAHQQIWYAQEVRGYAMMMAAIVGAAAALARIERWGFSAGRGVALAGCLLAAMLTHYYAAAGCAAIGLYAVIRLRGPALRGTFVACAVAALVFGAIWGPFLVRQFHAIGPNSVWTLDDGPGFVRRWGARLLVAPMRLLSPPPSGAAAAAGGIWVLLVLPLFLARRRPALLLPALLALACIGLPTVLDLARSTLQLDHERYYLAAGPSIGLLAAGLLAHRRGLAAHLLPAALALYCALSLPWAYVTHKADWRGLGTDIARSAVPEDLVVFYHPPADWYSAVGYLAMDYYAPAPPRHVLILDRPADASVAAQVRTWPGTVWSFTVVGPDDVPQAVPGMRPVESRFETFAGYLCRLRPAEATQ